MHRSTCTQIFFNKYYSSVPSLVEFPGVKPQIQRDLSICGFRYLQWVLGESPSGTKGWLYISTTACVYNLWRNNSTYEYTLSSSYKDTRSKSIHKNEFLLYSIFTYLALYNKVYLYKSTQCLKVDIMITSQN